MSEPLSLLEFLQTLLTDGGMRDDFLADPHATLADHGLAHLSSADVHDALVLVEDTQTADFGHGAVPMPLAPPPDSHADAVGYLRSYLSSGATTTDLAFGAGALDDAGVPELAPGRPDDGQYDPFDLDPAGAGAGLDDGLDDGFGTGAGPHGIDPDDPYSDSYGEIAAEHHDVDF